MSGWKLPPLPESLRLRQSRWPLAVLLVSIGLTAVAAFDAQRAIRSQRELADKALHDYASFAAWSYAQHLVITLNMIEREAIGAVNHGDNMHSNPRIPVARELAHYLPWDVNCECHRARMGPNPDAFFALKLGVDSLDIGVNTHPNAAEGWEVDRPLQLPVKATLNSEADNERFYDRAERKWVLDSLPRRVRRLGEIDHGFSLVVGNVDNTPRVFAYTLMPTSWGDTMVYGARYSKATFVTLLESILDSPGLLPETFSAGHRNRDVLQLRVRDHAGNTLFDSSPDGPPTTAHFDLPSRAGLLSINASIRPELAGTLLIGGLPKSRLPYLLAMLALAAAMSIVAVVQLRREGDLARLRGDFVSSVSHELRTPLAQIRLYVETLQLGRAPTEAQRQWSLAHIERETTRLSHLVENVLRFSTLGRSEATQLVSVDVGAEAARIANEFAPLAASRKARVEVAAEITPAPHAFLRPDALRHMMLNLLDNAVKYGPPGQTIRVGVRSTDATVTITVDDQGPGVVASEREAIWRAFNRGEAAKTNGGSGIGLTIVREVAETHGGTASVEAAPGGGARFTIVLPVQQPVES